MRGLAHFRRYRWLPVGVGVVLVAGGLYRLDPDPASAARAHRHVAALVVPAALAPDGTVAARRVPKGPPGPGTFAARRTPKGAKRPAHWLASWGASAQAATPGGRAAAGFDDETIRNVVLSSVGGSMVRVRFTNAFGSSPLVIGAAAIGVQRSGAALAPGTSFALSFGGHRAVMIRPGAEVLSDPLRLMVRPVENLAVSVYLPYITGPATEHVDARQITYLAAGAHTLSTSAAPFTGQIGSWYFLDSVDVLSPARDLGTVVAIGDSITDGVGSPVGANARWPNDLARRLTARPGATLGVIDEGIGGNRVLNASLCCGLAAVTRFAADVVDQSGAREVILLEGINDIGFSEHQGLLTAPHTDVSAEQIVAGYEQIIAQAHAAGLRIFGATLTPFRGATYWTPAGEAKREAVNEWIRTSGAFDGVIDFAGAVADPGDPERLNPADDSGDHLHPNAAGYRAMAGAINLAMLLR